MFASLTLHAPLLIWKNKISGFIDLHQGASNLLTRWFDKMSLKRTALVLQLPFVLHMILKVHQENFQNGCGMLGMEVECLQPSNTGAYWDVSAITIHFTGIS